uniref:CYCLIN domain-containing protein n=1 Tax=Elaeophora elaphi TaxID=1147741 RepID=A0A0R3S0C8_9BILA
MGRDWLFTEEQLANTPSRRDGVDRVEEDKLRREGIKLIVEIGSGLKLQPNPTLATAAVYFHRFYMFHSFKEFQKHILVDPLLISAESVKFEYKSSFQLTALGCLFLAGKVEETPKKCRDIVLIAKEKYPDLYSMKNAIEEVMGIERVLLQTIKFDLHVDHPYTYNLLKFESFKVFKLDREKKQTVLQNAWTFVNDSISTTLCLMWEPEVIAISLIYMALKMTKLDNCDWVDRQPGEQWWDQFVANLTSDMMEDVCHKVLDYYTITKTESR